MKIDKKVNLKNMKKEIDFDKGAEIRFKIARLIIEKKFKKAKELASKYKTETGYKMIEEYKKFKKQYDKIHS